MQQRDKAPSSPGGRQDEDLPYAVELWNESSGAVEKILARAFKISLARAIFRAAIEENPGRRIVLRHGDKIVEDSAGGARS